MLNTSSYFLHTARLNPASRKTVPATPAPTPAPAPSPTPTNTTSGDIVMGRSTTATTTTALTNTQAIALLKKPPFAPTNVNLFSPKTYPTAKAMAPAAARTQTATTVQSQLTSIFNTRFNGNTTQIKAGKALFNDPAITKAVPDVRLRGALVSLYGTAGQGAIDEIKSGRYNKVSFVSLPPGMIAQAVMPAGATKPVIQFNSRYQHEDIRSLASTMAHEPLHQDLTNSGREERIAHSLDTLVYGKFVSEDAALASKPTELTQRLNTKIMARVNSRDANGNLRLFSSTGNVFPNGNPLANFGAAYNENGGPITSNSKGNAYLAKFLKATTGQTRTAPNFDLTTETLVDRYQTALTPVQLIAVAKALKLKVG